MPTNGPAEGVIYSVDGIPAFTYGMIGITTFVIAYFTLMDEGENMESEDTEDISMFDENLSLIHI